MHTQHMIPLWKIPQSELTLAEHEIHIWRADLDLSEVRFQTLYQILPVDEELRVQRFHSEKDRRRFIAGRGILRTILGYYLSVEPGRLQFSYGKNGKPAFVDTYGKKNVLFNMSGSEGLALYAFTRDNEIGVDVEHVSDIPEMDQIAGRFFSRREYDVFSTLPGSMKKEAFFNCWTRKEAFIKAIGEGLSYPLEKFDVSFVPGEPAELLRTVRDSSEAPQWSIQDIKPAPDYTGAFAVKGPMPEAKFWRWDVG